jgi:hypothetical protein
MFGAPVTARPQRVIEDSAGLLVSYWPIGTMWYHPNFANRETATQEVEDGSVKWEITPWTDHEVLELVRPGDPYAILGFWNAQRTFVGWYANLQEPMRRTAIGFDSRDHDLDVIIGEDLASWILKDEHELEWSVSVGLRTREEAVQITADGKAVVEMVRSGNAWWGKWRDFESDPAWPVPDLPSGWDVL